jgi:hypothetical protein
MIRPMRTFTALLLLLSGLAAAGAARAFEASDCDADRERFFVALAENRDNSLRQLEAALAAAGSDDARGQLRVELEEVWHEEENGRAFADTVWRDCLRYVGASPASR